MTGAGALMAGGISLLASVIALRWVRGIVKTNEAVAWMAVGSALLARDIALGHWLNAPGMKKAVHR